MTPINQHYDVKTKIISSVVPRKLLTPPTCPVIFSHFKFQGWLSPQGYILNGYTLRSGHARLFMIFSDLLVLILRHSYSLFQTQQTCHHATNSPHSFTALYLWNFLSYLTFIYIETQFKCQLYLLSLTS